jgi:hypothetical protein
VPDAQPPALTIFGKAKREIFDPAETMRLGNGLAVAA